MPKIIIDTEKCIGCGACASVSDNFEIKDGKAVVKNPEPEDINKDKEAVDICPVKAITIK